MCKCTSNLLTGLVVIKVSFACVYKQDGHGCESRAGPSINKNSPKTKQKTILYTDFKVYSFEISVSLLL